MRRSSAFLLVTAVLVAAFALALVHARILGVRLRPEVQSRKDLVAALGLTDLALFNEARYTRHPSQADLHTAFQEHPASLEHFPTGSILAPPDVVRR